MSLRRPPSPFPARARVQITDVAVRRIWGVRLRGGLALRVTQSRYFCGQARGGYADRWRVEVWQPPDQHCLWGCWRIVSTHRLRTAAFAAAEKELRTFA
jgi:hypothetical protein